MQSVCNYLFKDKEENFIIMITCLAESTYCAYPTSFMNVECSCKKLFLLGFIQVLEYKNNESFKTIFLEKLYESIEVLS